ncbi:MAG: hypothetical protein H4O13_12635 [Xanthomonadales bacterium]|nr:hypothetical protein [Xanthomonadales bacterium]
MFESLIQVLHQLALNALGLILTLLSGGLPANEPAHRPAPEPPAQRGALLLSDPRHAAGARCGLLRAARSRIAFEDHT